MHACTMRGAPGVVDARMRGLGLPLPPKQAIVDKAAVVASAVLVSALHLLGGNAEVVKRWSNEIQEAVQSKHAMVQFHAVALLHALRAADRLAVSKLVTSLTRGAVRSPLAQCLLVRSVPTALLLGCRRLCAAPTAAVPPS